MTRYLATRSGIALLLAVLCLVLAVVVYHELAGTESQVAAGPGPVVAGGAPPLPPQPVFAPLAPFETFAEVIRRPLFSPTRQPSPEAVKETQGNANFALLGVIISDDGKIALVQHGRPPAMTRLTEGQAVEGWTVQSILPDRVMLRHGATEQEIKLKDRPAQPAQPRQPAAPPARGG
jgi:general secretion pathway protein N